jgi:hypothetical protein
MNSWPIEVSISQRSLPTDSTNLEPLAHLQLILIREVFHKSRYLQAFPLAFSKELEGDNLQSILNSIRNLSGMWSGNLSDGICLPNDKEILYLPYKILGLALDGAPEIAKPLEEESICGLERLA